MRGIGLICVVLFINSIVRAQYIEPFKSNPYIACSEKNSCPEVWPCCSQYGQCGSGPICVGGCNPKYSYSIDSCMPIPALLPSLDAELIRGFVADPTPGNSFKVSEYKSDGISALKRPVLQTEFRRKANPAYFGIHHYEQRYVVSDLEKELNSRGLIHFTDYLVTSSHDVADQMLEHYDFTHSGFAAIDKGTNYLLLRMPKGSTGTLITTAKAFLYGKASVTMKTSRGRGVITAIVFMSATQDEIDYEFVGNDVRSVQTNYYCQGELDHSKMVRHQLPFDSFQEYHNYEVDWDSERINWLIDGKIIRTLRKVDTFDPKTGVFKYPQTPMNLQISLWPAGTPDAPPGTVQWAGGLVDWDNEPDILEKGQLYATVKEVSVIPYFNRFYPQIIANAASLLTNNVPIGPLRISYAYDPYGGRYDEDSLKWYYNATFHLSSWKATGLLPGTPSDINSSGTNTVSPPNPLEAQPPPENNPQQPVQSPSESIPPTA